MKDLSIIIVNWNSVEFARDCIASIISTTQGLDYEVIVVDNDSQPTLCEGLAVGNPQVKVICSDRNIGFARANNLGLEHASGAKVLFLNPDTVVLGDALLQLVRSLDSDPNIGAVGCKLLNADFSLQTTCVQSFPTLSNQLLGIEWLQRRLPGLPMWGMGALFVAESFRPLEVDVVSGACLMARRSVLDEVFGFSTEYFMYAEEADLCYKIRRAGKKICYTGKAEIVHLGGQSTKEKGSAFADVVMRESVFTLLRKFRGSTYAYAYRGIILLSAAVRLSLLAVLAPSAGLMNWPFSRATVARSFRKWARIASWSMALEPWAHKLNAPQSMPRTSPR